MASTPLQLLGDCHLLVVRMNDMILCMCDIHVQCMASGTFLESIPRVLPHVHVHYTCTCTYFCKSIPIVRWQCISIHVIFLSLVAKPRGCFLAKEDVYLFQAMWLYNCMASFAGCLHLRIFLEIRAQIYMYARGESLGTRL